MPDLPSGVDVAAVSAAGAQLFAALGGDPRRLVVLEVAGAVAGSARWRVASPRRDLDDLQDDFRNDLRDDTGFGEDSVDDDSS